jgi:hypothetical protein
MREPFSGAMKARSFLKRRSTMSTDTSTIETLDPTGAPIDPDLKSERVQEESVAPDPTDPITEPDLKSERVQ